MIKYLELHRKTIKTKDNKRFPTYYGKFLNDKKEDAHYFIDNVETDVPIYCKVIFKSYAKDKINKLNDFPYIVELSENLIKDENNNKKPSYVVFSDTDKDGNIRKINVNGNDISRKITLFYDFPSIEHVDLKQPSLDDILNRLVK